MAGFMGLNYYTKLWTATVAFAGTAENILFAFDSAAIAIHSEDHQHFCPVRLIKGPAPMQAPEEVVIGGQTWSAKNWDYNYPGSRVYDEFEGNRAVYGGLYSFAMVTASDFCPPGWHVPSKAEWDVLVAFCGGAGVAGNKLKEVGNVHWNVPSAGTDDYGFTALPGGNYEVIYSEMGNNASFMTTTPIDEGLSRGKGVLYNFAMVFDGSFCRTPPPFFGSVRLIKD